MSRINPAYAVLADRADGHSQSDPDSPTGGEAFRNWLDRMVKAGLLAVIFLSPVPFGSVHVPARSVLTLFVTLLTLLSCLETGTGLLTGRLNRERKASLRLIAPLAVFFLLSLVWPLIQIVPLPSELLATVSPGLQGLRATVSGLADQWPADDGGGAISYLARSTRAALAMYVTYALFALLVIKHFPSRRDAVTLVRTCLLTGVVQAVAAVATLTVPGMGSTLFHPLAPERQMHGTFIYANHCAVFLAGLVMVGLGRVAAVGRSLSNLSRGGGFWVRLSRMSATSEARSWAWALMAVVLMTAVVFSLGSRGAVVALLAGGSVFAGGAFFIARGGTRVSVTALVLLAVTLPLAGLIGLSDSMARFANLSSTIHSRSLIMAASWDMFLDHPFTGVGLGAYLEAIAKYKPSFIIYDRLTQAHNEWLEILTETGLVGGVLILLGLALFIAPVIRAIGRTRVSGSSRWLALGAASAGLALFLNSTMDLTFRGPAVTLLWLVCLALLLNRSGCHQYHVEHHSRWTGSGKAVTGAASIIILLVAASVWSAVWSVGNWRSQNVLITVNDSTRAPVTDPKMTDMITAVDLAPDNPEYWYLLANSLARLGSQGHRRDLTRLSDKRLGIQDPDPVANPRRLSRLFQIHALRLNPSGARHWAQYGWLCMGDDNLASQVDPAFELATLLDPVEAEWQYQWGMAHRFRGDEQAAVERFRKAIKLNSIYMRYYKEDR